MPPVLTQDKPQQASGIMAEVKGSYDVIYSHMEHRDGQGNLIVRFVSVKPPGVELCRVFQAGCILRYFRKCIKYVLVQIYHHYRMEYAEKHRKDSIPMHYRTGENVPETIPKLIWGIVRIPNA